jgi:multidrug transporter EmrE-like cation transporter
MSLASLAFILFAVVLGTVAQLLLKIGATAVPFGPGLALEPRILGGMACYGVSLIIWIYALSKVPVSVAYPMTALGFALNAVLAWWLLGESLAAMKLAGIGFIIVGVVLVARS